MTFAGRAGRDELEVDAIRTDRYLDSLLAAHERRASDAPADAQTDAAVRDAAQRLGRDLVRFHPSFRFEERLAARLAEVAASMRLSTAAGAEGLRPPVPARPRDEPDQVADVGASVRAAAADDEPGAVPGVGAVALAPHLARPILIGGALTSAAISIAGAAYVAWRRSRAPQSAMARATGAARDARPTATPQPQGLD